MKILAAFLLASALGIGTASAQQGGMMQQQPRGGMMQQQQRPPADLKALPSDRIVKAVRYCDGTYHVTTGAGDTLAFPEFNLRFKTDSGDLGPPPGTPALLPANMMGDRAFLIFRAPEEISGFIKAEC